MNFVRPPLFGGGALAQEGPVPLPIAALREPECGECGLHAGCRSPKMPAWGQGGRKVLVVGEAPGRDEDAQNQPFCGPSGQLLRDMLRRGGVSLATDCLVTNALICRPPNNVISDPRGIARCRPNLLRTLLAYDPALVILLGGHAAESLTGWLWKDDKSRPGAWPGWQIPSRRLNAWVCPTFHPSFVLRQTRKGGEGGAARVLMQEHLDAACALLKRGRPYETVPDVNSRLKLVYSGDEAARLLPAYRGRVISYDYETDRLKPDAADSAIVCCAVSDGRTSLAFPWTAASRDATLSLLTDPSTPKVGYHIAFEQRWTLARTGVRIPHEQWLLDGMLLAHGLDSRRGTKSLKFQAFVRLGVDEYDGGIKDYLEAKPRDGQKKASGNERNRIRMVSMPKLLRYCAMDAQYEWEFAKALAPLAGRSF